MSKLPIDQAIQRIQANDERMDRFANGTDTETWLTSDGRTVPSFSKFVKDHDAQLNQFPNTIAGTGGAAMVGNNPSGGIASTTVQAALNEIDAEKIAFSTLALSSGSSLSGFIQSGSGMSLRNSQDELREWLKVTQAGASPSASAAINDAAFAAAVVEAVASGRGIIIPAGNYTLSNTWTISNTGVRIRAEGKVILNFTNAGICIAVDGGASVTSIYDVHIGTEANPIWINGNASTTTALFWRACHHGSASIKAWNCVTGQHTQFAVCNNFWITVSANERVSNVLVPTTGILCDHRGAGEDTADNSWYTPIIEGIKTGTGRGIDLLNTNRNKFFGGTSEGNIIGVYAATTALGDYFVGLYCEVNTGSAHYDISGTLITLADCLSATSVPVPTNWARFRTGATDCRVIGGDHPVITIDAGAVRTMVLGNAHAGTNTISDAGTNTTVIQGPGAAKLPFGANFGGGSATLGVYDELTWTPVISGSGTAGTPTYTVQNGTYQKIGKWVHYRLYVSTSNLGGATGNFQISLPTAASASGNTHSVTPVGRFDGATFDAGYSTLSALIPPTGTNLTLYESGSGVNSQPIQCSKFAATTLLMIEGKYMIP